MAAMLRAAADRVDVPGLPCPACRSTDTRVNPVAKIAGARLCDSCGCRWRP